MGDIALKIESLKIDGKEIDSFKSVTLVATAKRKQVNLMNKTKVADMTQRYTMRILYVDETQPFDFESIKGASAIASTDLGESFQMTDVSFLESNELVRDGENDPDVEYTFNTSKPERI